MVENPLPLEDDELPMDEAGQAQVVRNGHLLSALYGAHTLRPPRSMPDWQVFASACLARANYSLLTILSLDHREVDCLTLARSVYEHVVTMAWVSIDGPKHYPMHLQWERRERMKMISELQAFGSEALPPDAANVIKRATIDAAQETAPPAAGRAVECDRYWPRALPPEGGWMWHFRRSYTNLFRYCSAYVHPTVMGVDCFIERHPGAVQIGLPRSVGRSEVAVCAVQSFADGLAVASLRFGWPPMLEILKAFTNGFVNVGGKP